MLGSVVGKPTVERVNKLVKDAVAKGAKLLTGGDSEGTVMKGIVVDHVTPDMELFREESFGPQVSITRAKNTDDAIRLANDTEYGLSAALFTRDIAKGIELAKRIETGICHINGPTVHDEAADALRRREGLRLRPLRRQGRHRRVHRNPLDHHPAHSTPLPVLMT